MHLAALAAVVKIVAEAGIAVAALWGTFRWLPQIFQGVQLMRERDEARVETSHLREITNAMSGGTGGLTATIEAFRNELGDVRRELEDMRRVQIISARYIAVLIGHISDGGMSGTMPPIPVELRDDVLEHLRSATDARA